MTNTLGIVEIPAKHTARHRWIESIADRQFGGKPLLEWIVRRMTDATRLDHVVVIVHDETVDETLTDRLPGDIAVSPGDKTKAPAGRIVAALEDYQATAAVRVRLDFPFVDPVWIDQLVATAEANPQCDYIGFCSAKGKSVLSSRVGVGAEWFSTRAVKRAVDQAVSSTDTNDPGQFIRSHPELFQLRFMQMPAALDREDVRLRIEVEEDWEHATMILDALGTEDLAWQRIANLLIDHPAIRERMAVLNAANTTA